MIQPKPSTLWEADSAALLSLREGDSGRRGIAIDAVASRADRSLLHPHGMARLHLALSNRRGSPPTAGMRDVVFS